MNARLLELLGQIMLGDGVTEMIVPRRHMLLWREFLPWDPWRKLVQWFADRPTVTILVGVGESLLGLWCIVRGLAARPARMTRAGGS